MRNVEEKQRLIIPKQFANQHYSGLSIRLSEIIKNCEENLGVSKSFFVNFDVWYSRVSAILKIRGLRRLDAVSLKSVSVSTYKNYYKNSLDPETSDHEYLLRVKSVYAELQSASIFEYSYNRFIEDLDELLKGVEIGKYKMNTTTEFPKIKEFKDLYKEYFTLTVEINPKLEKEVREVENSVKNYESTYSELRDELNNNVESKLTEYQGGATKSEHQQFVRSVKKEVDTQKSIIQKKYTPEKDSLNEKNDVLKEEIKLIRQRLNEELNKKINQNNTHFPFWGATETEAIPLQESKNYSYDNSN